jgi:hypothetical protein
VFAQQLGYELGEANLLLLQLKLDKLRGRVGEGITFDERCMKKAEINKCNEYCRGALYTFAHFLHFYAKSADRPQVGSDTSNSPFSTFSLQQLKDLPLLEPDESKCILCMLVS